jgi:protein-S-isoprenylcysteine O-methyltransferase Ste14
MIEKIYLGLVLIFFILAFAIRNIKTYLSTKQSIRGKSVKLSISVLVSTLIYCLILLRLMVLTPKWLAELDLRQYIAVKITGMAFIAAGFILGILALIAMKNSWRVGIKYDQKTELVTSGIYRVSRNPYFLSYNVLIFGYILVFPSIILLALYVVLIITFHKMILEEEKYLESVHGAAYQNYKKKVNRYLTLK